MKLWSLLMLPWYGWRPGVRKTIAWLSVAIMLICVIGAIGDYPYAPGWTLDVAHGLAMWNVLMWALLVSNLLLLAHAARYQRLPKVQREALQSMGLYALLGIALPAVVLGLAGGDGAVIAVQLALGAGVGMAYAILPRYISFLMLFSPRIHEVLWHWLALPNETQPGFLLPSLLLAIAVWLAIAWAWRRVLGDEDALDVYHAPMLWAFRIGIWRRGGVRTLDGRVSPLRRVPDWLRPTVDLRGSGPGHAVRSLRIALGGSSLPQTPLSNLRKIAVLLLIFGFMGALLALEFSGNTSPVQHSPLAASGMDYWLIWVAPCVSCTLALITGKALQQRWSRCNAELPLLALLPGLGDPARVKRALLRASLTSALSMQAFLLLASILLAALWWHLAERIELLLLLAQFGGVLLVVMLALAAFGGTALRGSSKTTLGILGYLWACVSFSLSGLIVPDPGPVLVSVLVAGWVVFAVVVLWLGQRGWRGLQQRPHAFLAS